MPDKIGHFDICKEMARRNKDIRMSMLENVTNLRYSKRSKGTTVSIGVDGNLVGAIFNGKFVGGLLLCDKEQYFDIQRELVGGVVEPFPSAEVQVQADHAEECMRPIGLTTCGYPRAHTIHADKSSMSYHEFVTGESVESPAPPTPPDK